MTDSISIGRAMNVSALASAAFASLLALNPFFFLFAYPVALIHAFALALPIHSRLPPKWRLSLRACLIGSFLIGAIPLSLLMLLVSPVEGLNAWSGDIPTIVDGHRTHYYYVRAACGAVELGIVGVVGGIAFLLYLCERSGWKEE